jgi:xanthine dehydrogenase accessory factor
MSWLEAAAALRARREAGVLLTLISVRGHAPREAGAKMLVAREATWGTIGGGNLERTAIERARDLLAGATGSVDHPGPAPLVMEISLSDKAPARYGVQCCGGEVTVLFEELPVVPAVAIFGMGHVGLELARILARHDLDLHLVDSRSAQLDPDRLAAVTSDAVARVAVHHAVVGELVLGELPAGTHVLLMTHDHAEDAALCDAALRCGHLGTIGLIGSSAKWARFRRILLEAGHDETALSRVTIPIGDPEIGGKEPAVVALSVAADLVRRFGSRRSAVTGHTVTGSTGVSR